MATHRVLGKSVPRVDGRIKVTGQAVYGPDLDCGPQKMLYAKILRSPLPHALIRGIDTSGAEALDGVQAVITAKDVPERRWGRFLQDEELLASKKVTFVGQAVSAVAADTEEIAAQALELIEVEYEEIPAVFDPEEAMKPGSPVVHDDLGSYETLGRPGIGSVLNLVDGQNLVAHTKLRRGDVEQGFRDSDHVFEDTFTTQLVHQAYMEPHGAVARVESDGKIRVWSSGRLPHQCQAWLARIFDVPPEQIRISATFVGGMFGGKPSPRLEALCIVLSGKTGLPVKIVATRTEEFLATGGRHPSIIRIKTGLKKDGTIVARQVYSLWDTGAIEGGGVGVRGVVAALGPYRIPHVKGDGYVVYTNKICGAAYRGVGYTQGLWASESQIDMIAKRLGMDALELRLKNALEEGDPVHTGDVMGGVQGVSVKESLIRAAKEIGWGTTGNGARSGKGIAAIMESSTSGTTSEIKIQVNPDAKVVVYSGASECGQGVQTVLAQMAAEDLGVDMEDISVINADTEITPYDFSSSASRVTFHAGNALRKAVGEVKRQLLEVAEEALKIGADGLEYADGSVRAKESTQSVTLKALAQEYYNRTGSPLMAHGSFTSPKGSTDFETGQAENLAPFWSFGAQAADVDVDPETGLVTVNRFVNVADVGFAIHPQNVVGQMEGAMMMSVGSALYEESKFEDGRMINPSFYDYRIPTIMEAPGEVVTVVLEHAHEEGPFGAKGVGEVGVCSVAPAIANAVDNAVGARVVDTPITPERVLEAMEQK